MADFLNEVCGNCGLSFGSHCALSYYSEFYKREFPKNCCPGHEGRMNWDKGSGTIFKSTGTFKLIEHGTPASKGKSNNLSTYERDKKL